MININFENGGNVTLNIYEKELEEFLVKMVNNGHLYDYFSPQFVTQIPDDILTEIDEFCDNEENAEIANNFNNTLLSLKVWDFWDNDNEWKFVGVTITCE